MNLDTQKAKEFLARSKITNCEIQKVAGDASFRSYYRIFFDGKTNILMYAPPEFEDIHPFIKIDKFLLGNNFSAPEIFAIDEENGFILLEDFGDESYSKALAKVKIENPKSYKNLEFDLYKNACDCLIKLRDASPPKDAALYDSELLLREVMLFVDWYLALKNFQISEEEKELFKSAWLKLFKEIKDDKKVLVLRDYHADNLMIVQNRKAYKQVGLLDFQDAVIGSPAYDLVSLLEDARRDLDEENRKKLFEYYIKSCPIGEKEFTKNYEILSFQRNIKILGIFARLSLRDKKHQYLQLMPRVLDFVRSRLNSDILSEVSAIIKKFL